MGASSTAYVEVSGVEHARRQSLARGLSDRVTFETVDCNERLPFPDAAFDVVVCIDAFLHLNDRFAALADWSRLLRPQGRAIFTDAAVVTRPHFHRGTLRSRLPGRLRSRPTGSE